MFQKQFCSGIYRSTCSANAFTCTGSTYWMIIELFILITVTPAKQEPHRDHFVLVCLPVHQYVALMLVPHVL